MVRWTRARSQIETQTSINRPDGPSSDWSANGGRHELDAISTRGCLSGQVGNVADLSAQGQDDALNVTSQASHLGLDPIAVLHLTEIIG